MKVVLTIVLTVYLLQGLNAQWEPLQGPYGGWIWDLVQNEGFQFASTEHGVYRSGDAGQTWELLKMGNQPGYETSAIGINKNQLVTTAWSGISDENKRYLMASNDNGDNWHEINLPDSAGLLAIAINDYGIYISDYDHLWVSIDDGMTWTYSKLDSMASYFEGLSVYNGYIYVGSANKIYKSSLSGDEWTEITIDGMNESITTINVFDTIIFVREYEFGKLYRSQDGGVTWSHSQDPDWSNDWTNFIKINDAYYANYSDKIERSDDLGKTWKEAGHTDAGNFYKMINVGDTILGGTFSKGIFRSAGPGTSFYPSNIGIAATVVKAIAVDSNSVWTGCDYIGVSRQHKSSETWDSILMPATHSLFDIQLLHDKIFAIKDFYEIYRSLDDGTTWTNVTPVLSGNHFTDLYVDGESVLAGGISDFSPSHLFISHDDGDIWDALKFKIDNINYWPSLFARKGSILFTSDYKNVFRSIDHGLTWEITNNGLNIEQACHCEISKLFATEHEILALESNKLDYTTSLYLSQDNGDSWTLVESSVPAENFNGFDYITNVGNILIASANGRNHGISVSFDHAFSWLPFNEGLFLGDVSELATDDLYIYAATLGQGVWRRKISDLYTTSIQSPKPNDELSIYPNPSGGSFKLKLTSNFSGKATLKISDLSGKVCLKRNIELTPEIQVDAETLTSGLYFLSVLSGEKIYTGKIIVQK